MKLSDYVTTFLVKQDIGHVFVVSGGAAIHMIDSVSRNPKCRYICAQHEQHAGAEADGYARIGCGLGAAIVTSGPGATNLTTSIANAFFDSIPIIFICGQVATFRLRRSRNLRQKGFQETDTVEIFKPITKYAVQLLNPHNIRYELEKAVYLAKTGRPGPVVLDIPDDLFRSEIDPKTLKNFTVGETQGSTDLNLSLRKLDTLIASSRRPVLIVGAGIGLSQTRDEAIQFAQYYGIPVAHTWGGADVIPASHKLSIGPIGVCGPRSGNFAIQNADLIITIGTRLSPMITGGKQNLFAPKAKKVMVDIDGAELSKFTQNEFLLDLAIQENAKIFFLVWRKYHHKPKATAGFKNWVKQIKVWEAAYPICPSHYYSSSKQIQPHVFITELTKLAKPGDVIIGDTGANLSWVMQTWQTKRNQRIISAWSHTPMGYALPAAVGASFTTKKRILCLIGDGGLMMCLQELATVRRHKIPIKIFIFNNGGHSIQKQTLDTWLESRYNAVDVPSGLSFPDFEKIGQAFGIPTMTLKFHKDLKQKLQKILRMKDAILVNVEIDPDAKIVPMLKFGSGLEDLDPKISRKQLASIMEVSGQTIKDIQTKDNEGAKLI